MEEIEYENKKAYSNGYVKGFHDAKTLEEYFVEFGVKIGFLTPEKAEQLLKEHPQIVRCKDCKYCREAHYEEDGEPPIIKLKCENKYGLCRYQAEPDGFCSHGERKEGDGDG